MAQFSAIISDKHHVKAVHSRRWLLLHLRALHARVNHKLQCSNVLRALDQADSMAAWGLNIPGVLRYLTPTLSLRQTTGRHPLDELDALETGKPSTEQRSDVRQLAPHGSFWHRAAVIATCLSWTVVSSSAILVNKHVMVDLKFRYPITVAWLGLLMTTALAALSVQLFMHNSKQHAMSLRYYVTRVMPTGFFMAVTFQTGNAGYLYLTVAFVQMLKAFCPVVTMLLLFMIRLEVATIQLVSSVCMIAFGIAMASYGELHMSMIGLALMLISVVSESLRLVLTQYLLSGNALHPLQGLMYIGSACTLWLMVMAAIIEWRNVLQTGAMALFLQHPWPFVTAAFAGFGVNVLAIMVIKLSSSLTLKVLGTVKDAGLIIFGIIFLHEQVTKLQLIGYLISLVGFTAYNMLKATTHQAQVHVASKTH